MDLVSFAYAIYLRFINEIVCFRPSLVIATHARLCVTVYMLVWCASTLVATNLNISMRMPSLKVITWVRLYLHTCRSGIVMYLGTIIHVHPMITCWRTRVVVTHETSWHHTIPISSNPARTHNVYRYISWCELIIPIILYLWHNESLVTQSCFFIAAELSYGAIYCFKCKDYVYDQDFERVARYQSKRAASSLGEMPTLFTNGDVATRVCERAQRKMTVICKICVSVRCYCFRHTWLDTLGTFWSRARTANAAPEAAESACELNYRLVGHFAWQHDILYNVQ